MTIFRTWPFPATGSSVGRTLPDRLSDIVNVKDWGALGNNLANDAPGIQAAINYAIGPRPDGSTGGRVLFPPGQYLLGAPLVVGHATANAGVQLVGVGGGASVLVAFAGYTDTYGYVISKGSMTNDCLERIDGLSGFSAKLTRMQAVVRSCGVGSNFSGSGGAWVDASGANGALIESCQGQVGGIGNLANSTSPGIASPGPVGVYLGNQGMIKNCRIEGFCDVAVAMSGTNPQLLGAGLENHNTAVRVGWGPAGETQAIGATVSGLQTERVNCSIDLYDCANGFISAETLTTSVSAMQAAPIQTIAWTSTAGGTITCTTAAAHNIPSGNFLSPAGAGKYILQLSPQGGNSNWAAAISSTLGSVAGTGIGIATIIDGTHFSFTGTGANPGAPSTDGNGNQMYWMYPGQYGVRCRKVYETMIGSMFMAGGCNNVVASMDLNYGGAAQHRNNTCISVNPTIYGWNMPATTSNLAGWRFINCTGASNPFVANAAGPTSSMHFADLPSSSFQPGPFDGQEYDIIDSSLAAAGNFAGTPAGGGANHVRVRWSASAGAWLISG